MDKKTVTNRAVKEGWREKLQEHEKAQRARMEQVAAESSAAMNERHLRVASYIQGRAIETLKEVPIESAMDAVTLAVSPDRAVHQPCPERLATGRI